MKKRLSIKFLLAIIIMIINGSLYAEDRIKVGVYVIKIGEFSLTTGSFSVDFYLTLKSEVKPEYPMDTFEVINSKTISIEKIQDLPDMKQYRVRAVLNSAVDLQRFPFDKQKLQIIIENKTYTNDKVKYIPVKEESSLDKMVIFNGWEISGLSVEEQTHKYSVFQEYYSMYTYSVVIGKIIWNSFLKTFFPVLITMLVVACSFTMGVPDNMFDRFAISVIALIATVMFHINISNQIPPVSYFTTADKFMILAYMILLGTFFLNVSFVKLAENKKAHIVTKIHNILKYRMLVVIPLVFLAFFILV